MLSISYLCCCIGKVNHSVHNSLGRCFVQLLKYSDDYEQSRQVVENISMCSINNAIKLLKELGEFINENHSRRPEVIGERSRSKYQIVGFVRLGRIVIRTIMVSEILHKVALKESYMILLLHKISFNLRVLSYDTTGACKYCTEQFYCKIPQVTVCRMSLPHV